MLHQYLRVLEIFFRDIMVYALLLANPDPRKVLEPPLLMEYPPSSVKLAQLWMI